MSDPAIEEIEAQLRESRFKPWDVETFLANRHQAKIEALTGDKWAKRRQVAREIGIGTLAFIGYLTVVTLAGGWLLTGQFPSYQFAPAPVVALPN